MENKNNESMELLFIVFAVIGLIILINWVIS